MKAIALKGTPAQVLHQLKALMDKHGKAAKLSDVIDCEMAAM